MINMYKAKRNLFDRLIEESASGGLLDGWKVAYNWPGPEEAGPKCIYGGGARLSQDDAVGERGVLVNETDTISIYLRVKDDNRPSVRETDLVCEAGVKGIGKVLRKNPDLGDGVSWNGIREGAGDYETSEGCTVSITSIGVVIGSLFGYDNA